MLFDIQTTAICIVNTCFFFFFFFFIFFFLDYTSWISILNQETKFNEFRITYSFRKNNLNNFLLRSKMKNKKKVCLSVLFLSVYFKLHAFIVVLSGNFKCLDNVLRMMRCVGVASARHVILQRELKKHGSELYL